MLLKTHLMFAALIVILFVQHVNHPFLFITMVVLATIIPDMDTGFSTSGRSIFLKPIQFFVKHRGMVHSFTFAVLVAVLLSIFFPVLSLGFFMGYSVHLICDSFTREGIQPFWPLSARSGGFVKTGGRIEDSIFFSMIFINIVLFIFVFVV
jgi:inner membrane protein